MVHNMSKKQAKTGKNIKFYVKDIRCFEGKQVFDIRPLTFLVGENSTGKTTVLGCFSVLFRAIFPRYLENSIDFNMEPYNMGSFENIARKSKSKNGKKINNEFKIGFESQWPNLIIELCFRKDNTRAEPIVKYIDVKHDGNILKLNHKNKKIIYTIKSKNERYVPFPKFFIEEDIFMPIGIALDILQRKFIKDKKKDDSIANIIRSIRHDIQICLGNITNLAPVRSKPQRTYNSIREAPNPEGKEVPMYLMRISSTDVKKWEALRKQLITFGKNSGMFTDIKVEKFGKKSVGGPFELQFSIRGTQSNFMDIGYGVSQVLPLLVRILVQEDIKFVLQQPEVHLHPKAQAELASLFITSIKNKGHSFLIETHSDYMVDRARIEIQKGKINPDQVSVIYLETLKNGSVKAHNISFDKQGNVLNAPPGYRSFFLKEMDSVLGFNN